MSPPRVIAIDGPAGAGKSTIAKALAQRLGLEYLDTGAMYRAVTLAAIRRGIPVDDVERVAALAERAEIVVDASGVFIDGDEVTGDIRTHDVTAAVGPVAANSRVRAALRRRQRAWGDERGGGVIEGRDIGTDVFPDAPLKVYLTASPRVRAERRVAESGGELAEVEALIAARDHRDETRVDGALREAEGSVLVDTTGLGVDEVVDAITVLLERRA